MGRVGKSTVRIAVLPVAGFGTRMLPATKAVPKEMLPILGKPMIQYAVEECRAAGIEEIIFVTSPGKSAIEAHFTRDPALEKLLERRGQKEAAHGIRELSTFARMRFVEQSEPLGLGHAVLCARSLVGREPFAVLLPDVFLLGPRPALRELVDAFAETGASVVTVERVGRERISQCGIVAVDATASGEKLYRVRDLVEKPNTAEAPSDLGIMGRYVLVPEVFECLESTEPGSGNEIQLTDALGILARQGELQCLLWEGESFDAGDARGFFKLGVEFALRDAELGAWLRRRLGPPHSGRDD